MAGKKDYLTMKALEKQTGMSRTSIQYYINEGLLPKPHKTARNMSYYDQRFVDGLKMIRLYREKYDLSIEQIRKIISRRGRGHGMEMVLDIRERLLRDLAGSVEKRPLTWNELREASGLDESILTRLKENNLIFPLISLSGSESETLYHNDNGIICRIFRRILESGASLDILLTLSGKIEELIQIEKDAARRGVDRKIEKSTDASSIAQIIKAAVNMSTLLISLLHYHTFYRQMDATRWTEDSYDSFLDDDLDSLTPRRESDGD